MWRKDKNNKLQSDLNFEIVHWYYKLSIARNLYNTATFVIYFVVGKMREMCETKYCCIVCQIMDMNLKKDSYKHKSYLKDMLSLSREIIVTTTIRHGPFPSIIMDYAAYWGNRSEWFEFVFAIFLSVCVDVKN